MYANPANHVLLGLLYAATPQIMTDNYFGILLFQIQRGMHLRQSIGTSVKPIHCFD